MKIIFFALAIFLLSGAVQAQVVAFVNGHEITQAEIDSTVNAQLLPLHQQIYALRRAALENRITRILLEEEAMRLGITPDALKKSLTDVKVTPTDEEVNTSYQEM